MIAQDSRRVVGGGNTSAEEGVGKYIKQTSLIK